MEVMLLFSHGESTEVGVTWLTGCTLQCVSPKNLLYCMSVRCQSSQVYVLSLKEIKLFVSQLSSAAAAKRPVWNQLGLQLYSSLCAIQNQFYLGPSVDHTRRVWSGMGLFEHPLSGLLVTSEQ